MSDRKKQKAANKASATLPPIPDKRYFTIGEVGRLCDLKPHVLRYWEQEFNQLAPTKRRNRRYYQHKDVVLVRRIRHLLYEQGFTIEGARLQLVVDNASAVNTAMPVATTSQVDNAVVRQVVTELEKLVNHLT